MKRLLLTMAAAAITMAAMAQTVTLNFTVKDMNTDKVNIFLEKTDTALTVDNDGKASVTLPLKEAQYGMLQYKFRRSVAYFEPGQNLDITYDMTPSALTVDFAGGNADKNNFINGKELKGPLMGDFGKGEEDLLAQLEDYQAEDYSLLESKNFDATFTQKEKQRIDYWIYGMLCQYAAAKECTPAVYEALQPLVKEEPWLAQLSEYTNYMSGAIMVLANRDAKGADDETRIQNAMKYTIQNIKGQEMKDYLLGTYGMAFVESYGVNKAAEVKTMVEQNVKDPQVLAAFNATFANGKSLAQGTPSPDFSMTDINGKTYTLADLKGRVLYVDVWATWCVPCREEIPHLKELQQSFEGSNIMFVSMSIDKDKAAWQKMVKEEGLGGLQLYAGPDNAFCNEYKITGIPRFILIDKEGRIVEANMTRPSDEKTVEILGSLAEALE